MNQINEKTESIRKMSNPESYIHSNGVQRRDANTVLEEFIHLVNWRSAGNDTVLDIGCGIGDVTFDLLRPKLPTNARLFGVDICPDMTRFARLRYPDIEFTTLDIAAEELPQTVINGFDHLFSFYCLHWVLDQRQAMKNIYDLLRPGGDMLLTFLASNPIYDVYYNMSKMPIWMPYLSDLHKYISPYQYTQDVEEILRKLLNNIGFDIKICECRHTMYEYENLNAVQRAMTAVNPFLLRLPTNLKNQFIDDYINGLKNINLIEENNNSKMDKITMSYRLIIIFATKPN